MVVQAMRKRDRILFLIDKFYMQQSVQLDFVKYHVRQLPSNVPFKSMFIEGDNLFIRVSHHGCKRLLNAAVRVLFIVALMLPRSSTTQ